MSVNFSHFSQHHCIQIKQFDDLFIPPPSPGSGIDPWENVLNQVRSLDDEMCHDVRTRLFMGQLHDIKNQAGMVQNEHESGATGGIASPVPPPVEPPANVNIVSEYLDS